jgi:NADH dehydrogenase FAD-containing subunit
VFVVRDAASVMQNEHPVPGVAQAAIFRKGGTSGG